ncbi:hypothetical protein BB559_005854 [Furculomyces boomerangus]|uniref:Uncharacterized protein n=1 Tax=Furculomyces boomerangus TaxID=61424 RepID=A0A2T9Y6D1_9FUNG|nr:hypothetical protein BB559_005854 [Furculomyces boomerangus]
MKFSNQHSILFVLILISSVVQSYCSFVNIEETSSRNETKKWSQSYCCQKDSKTDCGFTEKVAFSYFYKITNSLGLSYLMSIGNIVGKSITKTESYEGTLNFSIAPGRCKYATITYEMARIRASGSCSYWYTTYKPILEIQFLEYAKNITNFELVETAKD